MTDSAQKTGTNDNHRICSVLLSSAPYFQSSLPYHPGDTHPLGPRWVHGREGKGSICDFLLFIFLFTQCTCCLGAFWWLSGKELACQYRRPVFEPWIKKISWRREWLPTPVFLPGELHGQKSLVG